MARAQFVLWDLDGTLLHAGSVFTEVRNDVLSEFLGFEVSLPFDELHGRTDGFQIREILRHNDVEGEALDRMVKLSQREIGKRGADYRDALRKRGSLLPGVTDALMALSNEKVISGVVTGNTAVKAVLKGTTFGLDAFIDFEIGGFGSDSEDRNELVAVAQKRLYKKMGVRFDADETWVVGDTPHDLAAARHAGVRCALVASGPFALDELQALNSEVVIADLTDLETLLSAMELRP